MKCLYCRVRRCLSFSHSLSLPPSWLSDFWFCISVSGSIYIVYVCVCLSVFMYASVFKWSHLRQNPWVVSHKKMWDTFEENMRHKQMRDTLLRETPLLRHDSCDRQENVRHEKMWDTCEDNGRRTKMWDTRKCETQENVRHKKMWKTRKCEIQENGRRKKTWDTRKCETQENMKDLWERHESWEASRDSWEISCRRRRVVRCEWDSSRVSGSCHACEWVVSHMWMSHATHVNESCHTCEWVVSHMWMSRVTHVNESCHTCESVVSHMWMSRVTHVHESWHTCGWVVSHMWIATAES